MRLSELLRPWQALPPEQDREVAGLSLDSRRVRPGDAFVALAGRRGHGLVHLPEALAAGAVAVLSDRPAEAPVPVVPVPALRGRLGALAARLYGDPSRRLAVLGVNGTNGKTSVAGFLAQALADDGPVGCLGTLGEGLWGRLAPALNTTPDVLTVHRRLAEAADAGAAHAVMEVSSHALEQGRVDGVHFQVAVFTNLSRDHLDYHGDMAAYGAAKARLFEGQAPVAAVSNLDDPFGRRLLERTRAVQRWGYGLEARQVPPGVAWVRGTDLRLDADGLRLTLHWQGRRAPLAAPLLGRFQAYNLLAAATALLALGWDLERVVARLGAVTAPPGRMERFAVPGRAQVVVDYAHTPEALAAALDSLRPHTRGRLWCVFGCGGDRDRGKRPEMGAAARRADVVVITDDNPRSEDPAAIVADILPGLGEHPATVIHDRAEAIAHAIEAAAPEDVILVAGKGHEAVQIVGERTLPHSDRAWVAHCLGLEVRS